jgi:hypothetical protein
MNKMAKFIPSPGEGETCPLASPELEDEAAEVPLSSSQSINIETFFWFLLGRIRTG